jgi:hypothetical protein
VASAWGGSPSEYRDDEFEVVDDDEPGLGDVNDLCDRSGRRVGTDTAGRSLPPSPPLLPVRPGRPPHVVSQALVCETSAHYCLARQYCGRTTGSRCGTPSYPGG